MMLLIGLTLILQEKLNPYKEAKLDIEQTSYSSILETTKTVKSSLEIKSPNAKWVFSDQTWFINNSTVYIKQEDNTYLMGKNIFPLQSILNLGKEEKITKIDDKTFKVKTKQHDFTLVFNNNLLSEIILVDDLENKTTFKIKGQGFKSNLNKFIPPKDAKISELGGI